MKASQERGQTAPGRAVARGLLSIGLHVWQDGKLCQDIEKFDERCASRCLCRPCFSALKPCFSHIKIAVCGPKSMQKLANSEPVTMAMWRIRPAFPGISGRLVPDTMHYAPFTSSDNPIFGSQCKLAGEWRGSAPFATDQYALRTETRAFGTSKPPISPAVSTSHFAVLTPVCGKSGLLQLQSIQ